MTVQELNETPVEPVDSWGEVDPDWEEFTDASIEDLEEGGDELSPEEEAIEPEPGEPLEGPTWVKFELWAQNLSEGGESYLASTADFEGPLEVEIGELTPGMNMRFWIRLIDTNGQHSPMSAPVDMRLPLDLTPPVAPVAPTVQETLGMVSIHHSTELQGEKPADFSHINIYAQAMHPPGNPTGEPGGPRLLARFYEESSTVVGDFFHDVEHRIFATAVDTTGNESAWSPFVEVTPRLPFDDTELKEALRRLNEEVLPALAEDQALLEQAMEHLSSVELPGLQQQLNDGLVEVNQKLIPLQQLSDQNKSRLDELNTVTLPGINSNLQAVESDLSTAQGQLNTAQAQLNTLNNSMIPGITSDLQAAQGLINTIDSTALKDQTGVIKANHMSANSVVANSILANAVTTAKIATGAVTANEIAALTITANELATNSVTAAKILANSVTTAKIATNAVTANEIAANTITAGNIATNAIQTRHLQANSVGADQVIANSIGTNHLQARSVQAHQLQVGSFDNLFNDQQFTSYRDFSTSTNSPWVRGSGNPHNIWQWESDASAGASIVNVASGAASRMELYCGEVAPGDQMSFRIRVRKTAGADGFRIHARHRGENRSTPLATTTILGATFSSLTADSVWEFNWTVPSNTGIRELWIDFETLSTSTGTVRFSEPYMRRRIDSQVLVEGSVLTDKLAANSVVADKIATNAIQTRHITAGAVSTNELAANAVNADKIAANAITTAKIAANAVGANEIAANAITASQISAGAIDGKTIRGSRVIGGSIVTNEDYATRGGVYIIGRSINVNDSNGMFVFGAGANDGVYMYGETMMTTATLQGPLRMGLGNRQISNEGALVPDFGRLRIQGRIPHQDAGAEDMFTTGISPEQSFTSSNLIQGGTAVRAAWNISYGAPAPVGNRHPLVSSHGDNMQMLSTFTVSSRAQNPGVFQAICRSTRGGPGNDTVPADYRIRYFAIRGDNIQ